ncbi:DDB1- and CUL4-associated factor 8 [Aplysia californica]|uniref:DDB1- and CUL4-associated factor 8 n=1 Tax=Aplysia californica TaxID=6500 RepID=A0ABM0JGA4_APLCA|nr:DDB1- and CUL4-associated factor 8 [Aplysia californica]
MDEDGKEEDRKSEGEEGSGDASKRPVLKKQDSGITLDSCLSSKSEDSAKSPSTSLRDGASDADMNDSEWLIDSAVPSSSLSESGAETKSEDSPSFKDDNDPDTQSEDINAMDDFINEETVSSVKDTASSVSADKIGIMTVDHEDEVMADSQQMSGSDINGISNADSSRAGGSNSLGYKRLTEDEDDSPEPKRRTPDRWDEEREEEAVDASKKASSTSGDLSSEDRLASENLPDLTSDDDDEEEEETSESNQLLHQLLQRNSRRNQAKRRDSSSEDSDSSEDEGENDNTGNRDSDEEESEESNEEVKKAVWDIMSKPPPKPNWFVLPELRRREYGFSRRESLMSFNEKLQGSLEMVKRLVMVEQMKCHEGCVNALTFNRIGTLLASGSDDLNIVLWNWQRGRPSLIYDSGHRSNVFQAKFMPFSGDCHMISCARDGQVRLAELSLTGVCKTTRKLANHRGAAHKLALEMDSPNVFLSCGEDAVTFLFDLREERPHRLVTTKVGEKKVPLYSIHSNPSDSREFCVGGRDHYIRVYDKRKIAEDVDGGVLKKFCPDHLENSDLKANVTCACYSYNGSEILGSYNDEDIYLFDNRMSDGANYTHRYMGHRNNATVKGVNFYGPKSEFIVSGSDCGNIYFWDKETEAIINFQEGDEAGVINVLEPHPTLPILATSGLDHEVKLWKPSPQPLDIDRDKLKKTLHKNHVERKKEVREAEPEMIGGQMLWFLMHHFRNSARRSMRTEGFQLSSTDDDDDENSDDEEAGNETQCLQS